MRCDKGNRGYVFKGSHLNCFVFIDEIQRVPISSFKKIRVFNADFIDGSKLILIGRRFIDSITASIDLNIVSKSLSREMIDPIDSIGVIVKIPIGKDRLPGT